MYQGSGNGSEDNEEGLVDESDQNYSKENDGYWKASILACAAS